MSITHTSIDLHFAKKLEQLVETNLHSAELDNTFLANRLYMSEARLYRLVKQHYKISPNVFVRNARLRAAHHLLHNGQCSTVKDTAFRVGFTHVGYFIRRFEEFYGNTPGTLQRAVSAG